LAFEARAASGIAEEEDGDDEYDEAEGDEKEGDE